MVKFYWLMLCWPGLLLAEPVVLQDPTQPLDGGALQTSQHQSKPSLPELQGLQLGGGVSRATLSGQSYRVGDQVAGYRLLQITADGVVLEKDGQSHALSLYSNKVKIK